MNRDENKVLPADQVRGYLAMVEDDYQIQYPTDAIRDIARTCLVLMAQLEDAKAAQAMVVERAAERMDCVSFDPPDHWDVATQNEFHKIIVDECLAWQRAIRALADPSGVEALAALRAERDELAHVLDAREASYGISSNGNMWRYWSEKALATSDRNKALTAERDDLRARLAAAEAQVGALTNWRDDPESSEAWCAGNDYALTRLCKVLGVDPAKASWDGSDGSLDEEADALIWRILRANDDEEGRSPAEADRDRLAAANAALEAQVAADADLLLDAYKAVLVLHRTLDKLHLAAGAKTAENIADRIVAAHPEMPARASLRAALAEVQADARREGE